MFLGFSQNSKAQFDDPFSVNPELSQQDTNIVLSVSFVVPEKHRLYTEKISVLVPDNIKLIQKDIPDGEKTKDPVSGEISSFYGHNVTLIYHLSGRLLSPVKVTVGYTGCDDKTCFFPQTKIFQLSLSTLTKGSSQKPRLAPTEHPPTPQQTDWRTIADGFTVTGITSGYLPPATFLAFLEGTNHDRAESENDNDLVKKLRDKNVWVAMGLIIIFGLTLNLTPCVLPMIPVNIAIIGAGTQSGSRWRGFALGSAYGAGIALVYGILGLVVVLTSAQFGALNSMPWFNIGIAILFLVLSLAMFGVFNIDLTRFQGSAGSSKSKRGSFLTAFFMGGIAALLAGACVAPFVIAVLVFSTELYQSGNVAALILPFVLGLGMALPWPFAGAGLSFLPKPGMWMERIKYGFGIIILGASVYYGFQAYNILKNRNKEQSFREMLITAEKTGNPVMIDFWASWCKNCAKMEKSTFHDPKVEKKLSGFEVIKYQAEDLNNAEVKAILKYYKVMGLPTYVIIKKITENREEE